MVLEYLPEAETIGQLSAYTEFQRSSLELCPQNHFLHFFWGNNPSIADRNLEEGVGEYVQSLIKAQLDYFYKSVTESYSFHQGKKESKITIFLIACKL